MRVFKCSGIGAAYERAVEYVIHEGVDVTTEEGELTWQTSPITLFVDSVCGFPISSDKNSYGLGFVEEYAQSLIHGSQNKFDYDYHQRLFKYNIYHNQIEYVVNKLKEHPTSRRAVAITWQPELDHTAKNVPCLQLITFQIMNRKLNMQVVFRSNDVLMALYPNMYGLASLQNHVANKLQVSYGSYTHIIMCPHIYYKRDENYLEAFL